MTKKLLFIGSSLNYGSPGKITENIGLLAIEHGWDVYQAHGLKYSNPSQLITKPVSSAFGEYRHAAYSLLLDRHGLSSTKETRTIIRWIKDIAPDVIHLHNLHGYYLNYKVLFDYLSSINTPIVWTLHDFWPITGHCAHFDYAGCYKWKEHCSHCPQTRTYPKSLFVDNSYNNFAIKKAAFTSVKKMIITPVSNWVAGLVKESFLGKYQILPVYNGVDIKVFKPTQTNLRNRLGLEDKFVMVGVASPWYTLKGLNDYFKLCEQLSSDFQVVMVGLTPKQIKELPKAIIGIEKTRNQQELAGYYSMADVVLNLSYQETFGMTTIEGMACGTPSIVYNRTALPELVTPETGVVVTAGDIDQLYKAILELKAKGKDYYSANCRKRVTDLFDKNKQFMKYIDLYESLISDC